MHAFTPSRGGHAPGHLRAMMDAYLDDGFIPDELLPEPAPAAPAWWITGQLWNCRDIAGGTGGLTYAQVSRRARGELRR